MLKAVDADRNYNEETGGVCIRLYDKNGEHKISLLPCSCDENGDVHCWDWVLPNGEVQYCGVENEFVDMMAEVFGWEHVNK